MAATSQGEHGHKVPRVSDEGDSYVGRAAQDRRDDGAGREVARHEIGPSLGAELRAAREHAGLGVREAARRLRIEHSYLIALERGERAPSAWTARRLIDVLALQGPTADFLRRFGRSVEEGIEQRRRERRARP